MGSLVVNRLIVTMDEERRIIEDGAVYLEDGKIEDIGRTSKLLRHQSLTQASICSSRLKNPDIVSFSRQTVPQAGPRVGVQRPSFGATAGMGEIVILYTGYCRLRKCLS